MKIGIDARFWGVGHSGLGVYTKNLVENLAFIDKKNSYFILLRPEMMETRLPSNFNKISADARAYSVKEQLLIPHLLYELKLDLVHFPSINFPIFYFGKSVVTIHDLIKHESRGAKTSTHLTFFYWLKYLMYLFVFWQAQFRSKKIITPTLTVKNDLIKKYPEAKGKIIVTYEAAAFNDNILPEDLKLPSKYAIYIGNAYPHKNLKRLIEAWKKIFEKTGVKLIFSSGRSVFVSRYEGLIKNSSAENYVTFMGYLRDSQLKFAFAKANIYVFPSLIEGFGIPGLDAMKLGLPVVCSDIPVFREIYGSAANYFNPKDVEDIQNKVIETITNNKLRERLIEEGKILVNKYSWEKMAQETLKVYESCISI